MLRLAALSYSLRLLLLALLLCGSVLQPALAAACDVEDARIALASGDAGTAVCAGQGGADGQCCDNPACGDCCLHAVAWLPALTSPLTFVSAQGYMARPQAHRVPANYAVDIRPPIRG